MKSKFLKYIGAQKDVIWKIILTLIIVFGGYICFISSDKVIHQKEVQVSEVYKKTTTIEHDGVKKFLEYVGLFLLVIAVWQWRKELGFDSFGFISKQPDVKPTDPMDRDNEEGDAPTEKPTIAFLGAKEKGDDREVLNHNNKEIISSIIEVMKENPNSITNVGILSSRLGLKKVTIMRALFELMRNGIVRKDAYPGSKNSVFSLRNSLDNLAVDYFIQNNLTSEDVLGDYRFIRLKSRYEVDALVKTTKTNYIIEVKFLNKLSKEILYRGVHQLLMIEEEINIEPTCLILLVVGSYDYLNKIELAEFQLKGNFKIYKIYREDIAKSQIAK